MRYGTDHVHYLIPNLRPNWPYDIRLDWMIDSSYTITPVIQGVSKPNVSMTALHAVSRTYPAVNSDNLGNITIQVDWVSGGASHIAFINAIEAVEN